MSASTVSTAGIRIGNTNLIHDLDRAEKHSADPIKSYDDIRRITEYLVSNGRYRDNALFWMGITFGVRINDLLSFRYGHLIDENGNWIDEIHFLETKTKNTRGKKKNDEDAKPKAIRNRVIYLTDQTKEALELYCKDRIVNRDDYIFPARWNGKSGNHMTQQAVGQIFTKLINDELNINIHASTHMFRKTFAYHILMECPERNRALEYLQMIFGHSSPLITLRYAGITDDEIRDLTVGMYDKVSKPTSNYAFGNQIYKIG